MAEGPRRVQLSRAKGWKMPPNTVKVDRTTTWGNPYKAGDFISKGPRAGITIRDTAHAVEYFRYWAEEAIAGRAFPQDDGGPAPTAEQVRASMETIRGKNLACWCKPGQPCHADVLIELANGPTCQPVTP